jgi:hypothetical protein
MWSSNGLIKIGEWILELCKSVRGRGKREEYFKSRLTSCEEELGSVNLVVTLHISSH